MKRIDDIDFLQFVGNQESQFIVPLSESQDAILERFREGVSTFGDPLPWSKTHNDVRLRPGEVSIWAGVNGHGKSILTSHVMANLMQLNGPVLMASLEMPISASGHRMIRQISGLSNPTPDFIERVIEWTEDKLWVYDQLDTIESERILGMVIYAMTELKCRHIFVDSLMKCGVRTDDYDGQKNFIDKLCWAAKTHGGHIHLIHHMRKGDKEESIPDKFDVKGAGELVDMVDNLFIVHRNKAKEKEVEAGAHVEPFVPDQHLIVAKQRHGEWEGKINLWFHKDSQQYLSRSDGSAQWFDVKNIALQEARNYAT